MNKRLSPAEIQQLSVEDRLRLIEELWDSLDAESGNLPMPDWQRAELDKRLDALDSGASIGSSWEDVRRRITGKP